VPVFPGPVKPFRPKVEIEVAISLASRDLACPTHTAELMPVRGLVQCLARGKTTTLSLQAHFGNLLHYRYTYCCDTAWTIVYLADAEGSPDYY